MFRLLFLAVFKIIKICIFSVVCGGVLAESYSVEAGYIILEDGKPIISREERNILVDDEGALVGYVVKSNEGSYFKHKATLITPRPKMYGGDRPITVNTMEASMKLEYPERECPGWCYLMLTLYPTDPSGIYRAQIHVNGDLIETIMFNVEHGYH